MSTTTAMTRTPRRTALLVGINYNNNPDAMLNGCYNDVVNVSQYLRSVLGYSPSSVNILTDGNRGIAGTASVLPPHASKYYRRYGGTCFWNGLWG